jgi:N-acetylglucosaminyldiphosphoundecaprenol N-acetyl-beta-D-mannosaminyltransferase
MELLGVSISQATRQAILARVESFLFEPTFHRIATVNPEFLVLATEDTSFKASLQQADLCVADGFGIVLVSLLRGEKVTRLPGADLVKEVLVLAERGNYGVALVVKKDGLSSYEEIREALLKEYPNLRIVTEPTQAEIVFCNFGAPEQELYLEHLRNAPGNIRLTIGVGGSFDYLTGRLKRAPKVMRLLGLEWLWRLILQPKRWYRIWNAVVVFPIKILSQNLSRK